MTRHITAIDPNRGHEVQGHGTCRNKQLTRQVLAAPVHFLPGSVLWRKDLLSTYGAIQCVDKRLHLYEFAARSLRLVPVKRSGQHLRMRIPVLDHTRAGFIQRFKSFAH